MVERQDGAISSVRATFSLLLSASNVDFQAQERLSSTLSILKRRKGSKIRKALFDLS